MIVEFLLVFCLFVSFAGWGAWAKILTGNKTDSFSLTILLGLSFFGIGTCLLSFFTALNLFVELILLIFSLIPFFFKKLRIYTTPFPKPLLKSVWFWLLGLIIILAGSFHPFRPDHFIYYEPTIQWLNRYGLIIGVANIDWNLGQMSVFHIMQAGLDQTIDPFQRIAVFITIWFLVYIFERKAYLLLFVIPFYFLFIQTPSPDVAIVFLSLVVVNELCFNYRVDNYSILLLISVFTFIIKPVAFWLPAWVLVAGFFLNKKELKDYRIYLYPMLFVVIFMIKNGMASSTLFYPVSFTQLDTYWLPNSQILAISDLRASAYTFDMRFTGDEISRMTFFQRFYYWLSIDKLQTIINCFITLTIVAFGIFSFFKKNLLYLSLWLIIIIKAVVVFSFSGQYRFILDGIYPLLFLILCPIRIGRTKIFVPGLLYSLLLLVLLGYPPLLKQSIPAFQLTRWMIGFTKKSLFIPENYATQKYAKENFGNLPFYISSRIYNYDTPPPAFRKIELKLYRDHGIFPQMKDPACIRKGYYMKTLTPEETEELGKIIEKYFPDS
ncbi:MAG: hypothetical protein FWF53_11675 [Candidatus Azobacteroides sp.]|nr:hypothetical protein [Candidatus Azobacteroides sp.]